MKIIPKLISITGVTRAKKTIHSIYSIKEICEIGSKYETTIIHSADFSLREKYIQSLIGNLPKHRSIHMKEITGCEEDRVFNLKAIEKIYECAKKQKGHVVNFL